CGGFGRPSERRSSASGRQLAARRTIKPGVIRALALALTASDPLLRIVANLPERGLIGARQEPDARILNETIRASPSIPGRAAQLRASISWARFVSEVLLSRQAKRVRRRPKTAARTSSRALRSRNFSINLIGRAD